MFKIMCNCQANLSESKTIEGHAKESPRRNNNYDDWHDHDLCQDLSQEQEPDHEHEDVGDNDQDNFGGLDHTQGEGDDNEHEKQII